MRIESVHLENFLSHEDTKVVFKGHTTVIVGPNGAGKSSVLDGILFGLYRETGRNANQ
ncbi:MAG: AAA family ATPase, partial [Sulfolobales archaeon]|nr:AAA family ATPase [Sulfolobales archaeon]